jgi:hypothetical protein
MLRLRRSLRELGAAEREGFFELRGQKLAQLHAEGATLQARLARRAVRGTPEWDTSVLKSAADERKWLDHVRQRLARWTSED